MSERELLEHVRDLTRQRADLLRAVDLLQEVLMRKGGPIDCREVEASRLVRGVRARMNENATRLIGMRFGEEDGRGG